MLLGNHEDKEQTTIWTYQEKKTRKKKKNDTHESIHKYIYMYVYAHDYGFMDM